MEKMNSRALCKTLLSFLWFQYSSQCCISWLTLKIDIDECFAGTDNCSDICNNTAGSYTCSCPTGYRLLDDGITCEG